MSSKMSQYHRNLRAEIGEEAYLARMAAVRSKRKRLGGPFRLDYVAPDGRTGSQIATEAGRKGNISEARKHNRKESR